LKSKIFGLLAMVMVALLVTGFAYAVWTETLYIEGTVETGYLDAQMVPGYSWDSEPEGKDYSEIYCYVEEEDPYTLIVVVENAYPCIDYYQGFGIENTGSIPLNITRISGPYGNLTYVGTVVVLDSYLGPISLPIQVDPGEIAWFVLYVHLDNNAEESSTYTFEMEITVAQWNEAPA